MIFPFLRGIPPYTEAPFTWALVYLNILLFCTGFFVQKRVELNLDTLWQDSTFISTTGYVFYDFLKAHPKEMNHIHRSLVKQVDMGDLTKIKILANMGLRNSSFLLSGEKYAARGDEVAIEKWKRQFFQFRQTQFGHPSYVWGLSLKSQGILQYISYQFAHGGFYHLVGNMFFLLIFGCFIEYAFGGLFLIALYIFGGIFSAGFFVVWSGLSHSPLIGASGSISGLMAFVGALYFSRSIPFAYFVLPFRNYYGMIFLPGWTILLLWLLTDIAGVLSTVNEFGGVAYSAHIGGAVIGLMFALAWKQQSPQLAPSVY